MTLKGGLAILCAELLVLPCAYPFEPQVQAPPPAPTAAAPSQAQALTSNQLESLVAPLALYPDPILSQVLVAATYPLEIVEAARWLNQNSTLEGKARVDAAAKQTWDASVQALVMFPDLLNWLNQNLSWTSDLGNAFLAQEQDVLNAVQDMRRKAENNGSLQSTQQQTVSTSTQGGNTYIEIQPASPDVVYVPQYDPAAIWGVPPAYYPYPPIYYPPVTGALIGFGVGVAVGAIWGGGWNSWGWNCGWGNRAVVVNNNFIRHNNFNRVNVGNGNAWVHNPAHRGGVPYNNPTIANRFNGRQGNPNVRPAPNVRPTPSQIQQGLNRANTPQRPGAPNVGTGNAFRAEQGNRGAGANAPRPGQGAVGPRNLPGDRIGNRSVASPSGAGAFSGINRGGSAARMSSSRGFASRGGGGFRGGGRRR